MIESSPTQNVPEPSRGPLAKGIHNVDVVSELFTAPWDPGKPAALLTNRKLHPATLRPSGDASRGGGKGNRSSGWGTRLGGHRTK